jgi:hypothetical protein
MFELCHFMWFELMRKDEFLLIGFVLGLENAIASM